HRRKEIQEILDGQDPLVMLSIDLVRHEARIRELVRIGAVLTLIADGERLHHRALALREERRIGARVHATGEEDSDRHVAHLSKVNRRAEFLQDAGSQLALVTFLDPLSALGNVPITMLKDLAILA